MEHLQDILIRLEPVLVVLAAFSFFRSKSAHRLPAVATYLVVRLASLANPSIAPIIPELSKSKNATNEKARRVLGWAPRSNEDSIVATAESLMQLGLLRYARKAV